MNRCFIPCVFMYTLYGRIVNIMRRRQPVAPDRARWKPVVRAYPENMEVLTEHGFLSFDDLFNMSLLGEYVPFNGSDNPLPGIPMNDLEWGQWEANSDFPLIGTVDASSGVLSYVKPDLFQMFVYEDELVHVKMKGVDVLCTVFSDLWLKAKYGRGFKFVLADNVALNKAESSVHYLVDKFNVSMYGDYEPVEGVHASLDSPITLKPAKHVKYSPIGRVFKRRVKQSGADGVERLVSVPAESVRCFNVVMPSGSSHTIVVRRARKDNNPRTPWVGNPVVVGDGSDKSVARVNAIKTLGG